MELVVKIAGWESMKSEGGAVEREKSKINFRQITGKKSSVLVIFRFKFCLSWTFETLEYMTVKVIFSEKLRIMVFLSLFSPSWGLFAL